MNVVALRRITMHALLLLCGVPLIIAIVYGAGIVLIPVVDGADKVILAAVNPDHYVPGVDQFFRALTDYTNFLIVTPLLSFAIAYLLYWVFRKRFKFLFTGLLAVETVVIASMAAMGKIWPNKTYIGANIILVIAVLLLFGLITLLFYRMSYDATRTFALLFLLVFLSGLLSGMVATEFIKKAVARPRPLNDANKPWNEQVRIIPDEVLRGNNSYPSGHTSGTFALLTPLFWYVRDKRGRAALMGWGGLQAFARVYTAAHFPFCCLMGGIMGFSMGTLAFFMLGGSALRRNVQQIPASSLSTAA